MGSQRGSETRRLSPALVVAAVVAMALVVSSLRDGSGSAGQPRIVLWGDSLAWESQEAFARTAQDGGADVLVRTWGGSAICDWLDDMRIQVHDWEPTVAVLSFSGNAFSDCMQGRDPLTAYTEDAAAAVGLLTDAGVQVRLVTAPPRPADPVGADGMTDLDRAWQSVIAGQELAQVVDARQAVTDNGQWAAVLPCRAGEPCGPEGTVTVRSPDGVHFCPESQPPMTRCPVYAAGAERFGTAMADGTLNLL